ncbi:MAG: hypothetical protein HPY57_14050 [Ignavibacteria bacterium]|nr:hypothetical protein [Ignavibacteria bacterium]
MRVLFSYDVEAVNKNFGKNFIKVYKIACKREKIKPDPKVLKLEDKDMYYIINYWSKIFKKRFEYLKKKLKLEQIKDK